MAYLIFLIVLAWPAETTAQPERPEVRAHRLAGGESIVVDGALDEPAWQEAAPATNFLQRDPESGAPATEKTEVRVVFDRDRLILGVNPWISLSNNVQHDTKCHVALRGITAFWRISSASSVSSVANVRG